MSQTQSTAVRLTMSAFGKPSHPLGCLKRGDCRLSVLCCFVLRRQTVNHDEQKLIHERFSHPDSADLIRQYAHQIHTEELEASEL